jgi:hypothetical protein
MMPVSVDRFDAGMVVSPPCASPSRMVSAAWASPPGRRRRSSRVWLMPAVVEATGDEDERDAGVEHLGGHEVA